MQALHRIDSNIQPDIFITMNVDADFLATMDAYIQKYGFQSREHFLHYAVLNQQCDLLLKELKDQRTQDHLEILPKNQQGGR